MKYYIFDNSGESLDRYTVIDKHGDMLALSETGAGVNMFAGNCIDSYMFTSFGSGWRRVCDVNKIVKHELPRIIREFEQEGNIGKRLRFSQVPKDIQKLIRDRFENDN